MYMSRQPRKIISILNALAEQPRTFESFIAYLQQEDLLDAWRLATDLSEIDNKTCNLCADVLAQWCTQELLKIIAESSKLSK